MKTVIGIAVPIFAIIGVFVAGKWAWDQWGPG